jgi:hypothetical protein
MKHRHLCYLLLLLLLSRAQAWQQPQAPPSRTMTSPTFQCHPPKRRLTLLLLVVTVQCRQRWRHSPLVACRRAGAYCPALGALQSVPVRGRGSGEGAARRRGRRVRRERRRPQHPHRRRCNNPSSCWLGKTLTITGVHGAYGLGRATHVGSPSTRTHLWRIPDWPSTCCAGETRAAQTGAACAWRCGADGRTSRTRPVSTGSRCGTRRSAAMRPLEREYSSGGTRRVSNPRVVHTAAAACMLVRRRDLLTVLTRASPAQRAAYHTTYPF